MKTVGIDSRFSYFRYLRKLGWVCVLLGFVGCSPADDVKSSNHGNEPRPALSKESTPPGPETSPRDEVVSEPRVRSQRRGRRTKTKDGKFVRNDVPAVLGKNQTILVLAAEPDVRAAQLYRFAREWMTPEQVTYAEKISASYDDQFLSLLRQRAQVLETASDDGNVAEQLKRIYQETIDLSQKVRRQIRQDVLSADQRKAMIIRFREEQKNKTQDRGTR